VHHDFKGHTLNVFVVMTGAYRFACDLVKYIKKINASSVDKMDLRPFLFKIEHNNHPEIFDNPIVTLSFLNFPDEDVH
jgi:hypoxanthine-guanine phosphoribosyltransferase